jgi:hypothetical protein
MISTRAECLLRRRKGKTQQHKKTHLNKYLKKRKKLILDFHLDNHVRFKEFKPSEVKDQSEILSFTDHA